MLSQSHRWKIIWLGLFSLATNALDIFALVLIGLIGVIAVGGSSGALPEVIATLPAESRLLAVAGLALTMFTLRSCLALLLVWLRQHALAKIETEFSASIAEHLMIRNRGELRKHSRAEIEWMVLRSTNTAFSGVLGNILQLVAEIGLAFFIFMVFLFTDWKIALSVIVFFLLVFFSLQERVGSLSQSAGARVTGGSIGVGQAVQDFLSANREIIVLNNAGHYLRKMNNHRQDTALAQANQLVLSALPRLIAEMGLIIGVALLTAYLLVWSDSENNLSTLGIFIAGSFRMMSAFLPIQRAFMQLRYDRPLAQAALGTLQSIHNSQPSREPSLFLANEKDDTPAARPRLGASVLMDRVSFTFENGPAEHPNLKEISLNILPGQYIAIVGPSGAGKSTLADLILGILEPAIGEILIDGITPTEFRETRAGELGYVPQRPGVVSGTVLENICLGDDAAKFSDRELWGALVRAQLADFVSGLPNGLDTDLGAHSDHLSGGQLQRLGLARALVRQPRLLILDEATSALDEDTQALITKSLTELGSATTKIVIAHRLSTVRNADTVIFLEGGQVRGMGSFAELSQSNENLSRWIKLSGLESNP